MNTTYKKKPMLIRSKDDGLDAQPWRVRTADGRVRGPVGPDGLKSLLEVGILNRAAMISRTTEENWVRIAEHPIWPQIQPTSKSLKLKAELMEETTGDSSLSPTSPVSEERMLKMEAVRQRERERSHQGLAWWQFGNVLRAIREVFIFLGFLTAGDLAASFFDTSAGLVKWGILLCLTCVAVMYYSIRALDR